MIYPLDSAIHRLNNWGLVPDQVKIARVVPIHKEGSIYLVSNYRPISLRFIFNKLIEKLMYNRIISYVEKFCIPHNNQFGFRSKHSTTHVLLLLTDEIQRSGLSIKAGSLRRSASCQTTLRRLVLPRYQLKRSILCLKSLKTCQRLQEIASKQMLFSKNFRGAMPLDPQFWGRRAPQNARCACQKSMLSPLLFPLY